MLYAVQNNEEDQLSGKTRFFEPDEAARVLWTLSKKWHTDIGPAFTVEQALYITRSVMFSCKNKHSSLALKARELQADIVRNQREDANSKEVDSQCQY